MPPRRASITGSADGLGLSAARSLIAQGHAVVLHARSQERAASFGRLADQALAVVIGDLSSAAETRTLADAVNALGRMDAVIHNAGLYAQRGRDTTADGHARTLAVNVLAPYILTALLDRPERSVYMSSSMHRSADASLRDIDWIERRWHADDAYSESKLLLTTLALALARLRPDVLSNAVDPGWVPTRMGGPNAPDDLALGEVTQTWLAVSDDDAARVSGYYWHHQQRRAPAQEAKNPAFQERVIQQTR